MDNYGVTKGTKFEEKIQELTTGEAGGATMYSALAYIAKAKGLDEVSDELMKIAVDELHHAGLYAVLNGQVSENIFDVLKKMAPVESGGVEKLQEFAAILKDSGLKSASEQIEAVALDEGRHGNTLEKLIKESDKISK